MNRKELTVFVQTTDEDTELSISSTRGKVVVLALPNGIKVGVDPAHLLDALYDLKFFKETPVYDIVETNNGGTQLAIGENK